MSLLGALGIDWKIFLIQVLNFLILFWILKKLFFKRFIAALKKEKEKSIRIQQGEQEIEKEKVEMKKREEEIIRKAKEKTSQIIAEGKEISEKEKERILKRTEEEVRAILKESRERAKRDIELMKEKEKREIVNKAERVVGEVLSSTLSRELQRKYLDEIISELKKIDFSTIKGKEVVVVKIISAFLLDREDKKKLLDFLYARLHNVYFKEEIDPSLIAGLKIFVGDNKFLVDVSLKKKIEELVNRQ